MKTKSIFFVLLSFTCLLSSGQKYKSTESEVRFFSDAPLEDIKAVTNAASAIIDTEKQTLAIVVPIRTFQFKKKLMQEHFNENYLESEKYPHGIFKGKITSWDGSAGSFDAVADGTLEIHGVEREVVIEGILEKSKKEIELETTFVIQLADHEIDIPKAVFYKIAEEVEIIAKFKLQPYEK
ncbi:MAG: YceI family protein [Bacteroidota bacterium]